MCIRDSTYTPSAETLARRESLPDPGSLPPMTVPELAATKEATDGSCHLSIFGFVMRLPKEKVFFQRHHGRDITHRQSRHARGISMDIDDDLGLPPFRLPGHMSAEELEYVRQWFDHYLEKAVTPFCMISRYVEPEPDPNPWNGRAG